jgi:hypothetical protein
VVKELTCTVTFIGYSLSWYEPTRFFEELFSTTRLWSCCWISTVLSERLTRFPLWSVTPLLHGNVRGTYSDQSSWLPDTYPGLPRGDNARHCRQTNKYNARHCRQTNITPVNISFNHCFIINFFNISSTIFFCTRNFW